MPENKNCRIKICGLTCLEDVEAANRFKPDYVGFVFAPGKRQVTNEQAALLKKKLYPDIRAVGVFVNSPIDEILELTSKGIIDMIQLHAEEGEDTILAIKQRSNAPVIKAVRVQSAQEISRMANLSCDYLLLDTYVKGQYGGSGTGFDWNLIPPLRKPFFLAGGLRADTINTAILTGAFCLDISSAAETEGRKDPEKMKILIETVRSAGK